MSEEWKSFLKAHWKMGLSYIVGTALLSSAAVFGGVYWLTGGHPGGFYHFLHSYRIVKDNYFRPIDENVLWQGASKGMLASLEDPYSTVLAGDTFNSFMETTNGEYGGIRVVPSVFSTFLKEVRLKRLASKAVIPFFPLTAPLWMSWVLPVLPRRCVGKMEQK